VGRVILGALAGYVTIIALSVGTTALLRLLFEVARDPSPPAWYHAVDFAYSTIAAGIGGYVAALTARHIAGPALLAAVFFAFGLASALGNLDPLHSLTYQWLMVVVGPIVIFAAGWWRLRRREPDTRPLA